MKPLLLCTLLYFTFSIVRAQTDTSVLDKKLKVYSDKIIELQSENQNRDNTIKQLNGDLGKIKNQLAITAKDKDAIKYINLKIDSISNAQQKNETERLVVSCQAGNTILVEMQKGLNIITFMQILVSLQDSAQRTFSPWSYKPIRSTWSRVDNYVTIGGSILTLSSLFFSNQDSKNFTLASGVSLIGLIKGIGAITKQTKKEEDKLYGFMAKADSSRLFINMSITAYDELVRINFKIKRFIEKNKKMKGELESFSKGYVCSDNITKKDEVEKMKKNISSLRDYIAEYESALKQVPEYLSDIRSFQSSMSFKYPQFKERTVGLITAAKEAEEFYINNIYPILKIDTSKLLSQ